MVVQATLLRPFANVGLGQRSRIALPTVHGREITTSGIRRTAHAYGWRQENLPHNFLPGEPLAKPSNVAILGGGITGLAAALFLRLKHEGTRITIFESSNHIGGWLQSSTHHVDDETVIFEQGPRSLRPAKSASAQATLSAVKDLQMVETARAKQIQIQISDIGHKVLATSRRSAAALNRFIYYPDRLCRLPNLGNGFSAWLSDLRSPLCKGVPSSFISEFWRSARGLDVEDESIGSFVSRRFSPALADNIASAGIHGIYAGDIELLSAKSIFPRPWALESNYGSLGRGALDLMTSGTRLMSRSDRELALNLQTVAKEWNAMVKDTSKTSDHRVFNPPRLANRLKQASLYTFDGGIETLVQALTGKLQAWGVKINTGARVSNLTPQEKRVSTFKFRDNVYVVADKQKVRVAWLQDQGKNGEETFSHVISALPAGALLSALSNNASARPVLTQQEVARFAIPTVTVMVVNLYYRSPGLVKQPGFGYLIPRSLEIDQNPEFGLGVVFDSFATPEVDNSSGTKLTVMLGGHWWDGWGSYPSEAEGIEMARSLLSRHLGIIEEPALAVATLQKDCIPQYHVGHSERTHGLADKIEEAFHGRLVAAGASWHGVSVNDCILSGFRAAWSWSDTRPKPRLMQPTHKDWSEFLKMPAAEFDELFKEEPVGPSEKSFDGRA